MGQKRWSLAPTNHYDRRRLVCIVEVPRLPSKPPTHTSSTAGVECDDEEYSCGCNRQPYLKRQAACRQR